MNLCNYKNALGVPGKGIHSWRFMNIAVADVLMTLIGAYVLSKIFGWTFWKTAVGFFLLGIVLHHLFCVKTTVDRLIFGD